MPLVKSDDVVDRGSASMVMVGLPPLPQHPDPRAIDAEVPVQCVDGLCIALVAQHDVLVTATDALTRAMETTHAPSGTLLLAPADEEVVSPEHEDWLADRGISVTYAASDDLSTEARAFFEDYWDRRRATRVGILG